MFNALDEKNKGYLDLQDFGIAFDAFRHQKFNHQTKHSRVLSGTLSASNGYSVGDEIAIDIINDDNVNLDMKESKESQLQVAIFQRLAIRRLKKRDRIYFADFWDAFVSLDNKNFGGGNYKSYDITEIDYPLHFMFEYLINGLRHSMKRNKNDNNKLDNSVMNLNRLIELPTTVNQWDKTINSNLQRLFYFAIGLEYEIQLLPFNGQNIFVSIVLAMKEISDILMVLDSEEHEHSSSDEYNSKYRDICIMCQLFCYKVLKELLTLPTVHTSNVLVEKCQLMIRNIYDDHDVELKDNSDDSSDSGFKFEGNVFDLCLHIKSYSIFGILLDSYSGHSPGNEKMANTILKLKEKLGNFSVDTLTNIIKEAVGNNTPVTVELVLPLALEKITIYNDVEKQVSDDKISKYLVTVVKEILMESVVHETMIVAIFETFNAYFRDNGVDMTIADLIQNNQTCHKMLSELTVEIVRTAIDPKLFNFLKKDFRIRSKLHFQMIQDNYVNNGYSKCKKIDDNITEYQNSLATNAIPSIAIKCPSIVNRGINYLVAETYDGNVENIKHFELLLDGLCKHYDPSLLCQNILNHAQFWYLLVTDTQTGNNSQDATNNYSLKYRMFVYFMKNYVRSIDLTSIEKQGQYHPLVGFFEEHDARFLFDHKSCVMEMVNVINDNITLIAQNAIQVGYYDDLYRFLSDKLNRLNSMSRFDKARRPEDSDQMWNKVE